MTHPLPTRGLNLRSSPTQAGSSLRDRLTLGSSLLHPRRLHRLLHLHPLAFQQGEVHRHSHRLHRLQEPLAVRD